MKRMIHVLAVVALGAGAVILLAGAGETPSTQPTPKAANLAYEAQDFSRLVGMTGLSDQLLKNHFTLYQGYVKNTNLLLEKLRQLDPASVEYAELKRRFGFEFDGMRMHELYFGNLIKDGQQIGRPMRVNAAIEEQFGGFDAWKRDFLAVASMRGVGWVVLYLDPQTGRLFNEWIGEHQVNHLVGCEPLLVIDVWEHAFMLDYGLDRKAYLQTVVNHIDWNVVADRYDHAARR